MVDVQFNSKTTKLLEVFQSFSFLIFQLFFLYKIEEMLSLAIFQETLNKCEKTKDDFLFIWLWPLTCILFFSPKLMSILNFQMTQCLYSVWLKSCKWFYEVKMRSGLRLLQKDMDPFGINIFKNHWNKLKAFIKISISYGFRVVAIITTNS